ncbi:hypothetical protein [Baaleninema simplex]|uniref:hypothetical protein n=1 Tax=Baaleninema simplex TaxID=2862350 RepID=UPI00034704B5|nr:hypothetical protein [Baaleninema simplex]
MTEFNPPDQILKNSDLNLSALSEIFSHRTTSYKYLFFISWLDILKFKKFDVDIQILFRDIVVEILVNSWLPYKKYNLYFGKQDKIANQLDSLAISNAEIERQKNCQGSIEENLRSIIASQDLSDIVKYLKRYVPFRLISPFLKEKLEGIDIDHGVDREIPRISIEEFDRLKPLYCFDIPDSRKFTAIIVHPDWATYIQNNYSIVRNWASWEWLQYMQSCNPKVDVTPQKLFWDKT